MPITVEMIDGMTIAEMYEVLEKAGISVRKNLSSHKLKAILTENLKAINKKVAEAVEAGKDKDTPPNDDEDDADKTNQPDKHYPPSEEDKPESEEEIDTSEEALQKLYKRRAALDAKRDTITKEIQKVMAARKEAKTLTYGEMLAISRKEETAEVKNSKLDPALVKTMTRKLAVKRGNAQVFADSMLPKATE